MPTTGPITGIQVGDFSNNLGRTNIQKSIRNQDPVYSWFEGAADRRSGQQVGDEGGRTDNYGLKGGFELESCGGDQIGRIESDGSKGARVPESSFGSCSGDQIGASDLQKFGAAVAAEGEPAAPAVIELSAASGRGSPGQVNLPGANIGVCDLESTGQGLTGGLHDKIGSLVARSDLLAWALQNKLSRDKIQRLLRLLDPIHLRGLPIRKKTRKWPQEPDAKTYRHHFYRQAAHVLGFRDQEVFDQELTRIVRSYWQDVAAAITKEAGSALL